MWHAPCTSILMSQIITARSGQVDTPSWFLVRCSVRTMWIQSWEYCVRFCPDQGLLASSTLTFVDGFSSPRMHTAFRWCLLWANSQLAFIQSLYCPKQILQGKASRETSRQALWTVNPCLAARLILTKRAGAGSQALGSQAWRSDLNVKPHSATCRLWERENVPLKHSEPPFCHLYNSDDCITG